MKVLGTLGLATSASERGWVCGLVGDVLRWLDGNGDVSGVKLSSACRIIALSAHASAP